MQQETRKTHCNEIIPFYKNEIIMNKLVLIRHGESTWNQENRFTGWVDVPLTQKGKNEAIHAGQCLKNANFTFDLAFTSVLTRAIDTLHLALSEMKQNNIPTVHSWRLNERHYGALAGLNKAETAKKFGDDQVHIWRRSFAVAPPKLSDKEMETFFADPRYTDLTHDEFPRSESLKDTIDRVLPFWHQNIFPELIKGKQIIIAAHGNSLRGLAKHLSNITDEAIASLNIPNGKPLVYEFDSSYSVHRSYYLLNNGETEPFVVS